MHVLLIPISYPNSYNRQSHVFFEEQARALSDYGLQVGVIAVIPVSFKQIWKQKRFDMGFVEEKRRHVMVYRYQFPSVPFMRRLNSRLQTWLGKRLFLKYQQHMGNPDIAHVHVSLGGRLALWLNDAFQLPFVVTEHYTSFTRGNMPSWQKDIAQRVFSVSKRNIAVSNEFKARLERDFGGDFEYIPNIVDTNFFVPRRQENSGQPARNFLNVGNLKPQKSQDILIRAFASSFREKSDYKLIIAGSGPEESRLKKIASSLEMKNDIIFYGQADRDEVVKLMQQCDCFVLSSTYETFGVVVIEALSCGIPVIATRSGGPESIITDEELGILCDIDETQLSKAMTQLSKARYNSDNIREYAVTNFSPNVIAQDITTIYKKALN